MHSSFIISQRYPAKWKVCGGPSYRIIMSKRYFGSVKSLTSFLWWSNHFLYLSFCYLKICLIHVAEHFLNISSKWLGTVLLEKVVLEEKQVLRLLACRSMQFEDTRYKVVSWNYCPISMLVAERGYINEV